MNRNERGDSKHYYDWLYKAHIDLLSAALLMENEHCRPSAAFHCQQCAEKALKAYLLYTAGRLVDGHNLTWLCRQAVKLNSGFSQWLDECSHLNRYYIETRYPADIPLRIDSGAIARVHGMTGEIFEFICQITGFRFERYRVKTEPNQKEKP